jgi:hypothetical protein
MHLSDKQQLFVNYLLERLQFPSDTFRGEYLEHLSRCCRQYVNLASKPIQRAPRTGDIIFPKDHAFKEYVEQDDRLIPTRFHIVDLLMLECDIKSRGRYTALSPSQAHISATDISHFTYCPVGWSIAKTYQLPKLISTRVGQTMHEQQRLLRFVRSRQVDGSISPPSCDLHRRSSELDCDPGTKELFRDLSESVAVFTGTTSDGDERKWFVGKDDRYIGQPDYVFYNQIKGRYFIVEEKFHMIPRPPRTDLPYTWCHEHGYDPDIIERDRRRSIFYENHLNQLRSYIYGIRDFGPLYGYLVYWRYSLEGGSSCEERPSYRSHIEQVRTRKLSGTHARDRTTLRATYKSIVEAMSNRGGPFSPSSRSPAKCAGCVQGVLCAHKTGRFNTYTFPYDHKYLQTKRVPFPDDLRRRRGDAAEENNSNNRIDTYF